MSHKPKLSKLRHILKAITYRVYSSCITFTISFLVTGNCDLGLSIGAIDFFVKIFSYYLHERFWYKINFGKTKNTDKLFCEKYKERNIFNSLFKK